MDPCGTSHRKSAEVENLSYLHGISYWIGMTYTNPPLNMRIITMAFLEVIYYDPKYRTLFEG